MTQPSITNFMQSSEQAQHDKAPTQERQVTTVVQHPDGRVEQQCIQQLVSNGRQNLEDQQVQVDLKQLNANILDTAEYMLQTKGELCDQLQHSVNAHLHNE